MPSNALRISVTDSRDIRLPVGLFGEQIKISFVLSLMAALSPEHLAEIRRSRALRVPKASLISAETRYMP